MANFSLIVALLLLVGCDSVDVTERVIYEDMTPVQNARVNQWNDEYNGVTYTDENGTWTLTVPADVIINLCINNPREGNKLVCFEESWLLTPTVESGETEMIKVDK